MLATTQIAGAIMAEAALSFLGLGMPVTKPSLGTLIRSGYDLMFAGAWWVTVLPGLVLIAVLISVNVLGDALRDLLDPRRTPVESKGKLAGANPLKPRCPPDHRL